MDREEVRTFRNRVIAAVCIWAVVAVIVAPYLIGSGHAEESLSFVNRVFEGRDVHPVGFYLDAWLSLALWMSAILVALIGALGWWTLLPDSRRATIDRALGRGPGLTPAGIVWAALCWGLVGGLAQALYQTARHVVTTRPAALYYTEVVWMAPLSAGIATAMLGVVVAAMSFGGRRRMTHARGAFVFGSLGIYGVIQSEGIPIHWWAGVLLSLGLASLLSRTVASRRRMVERAARASRPVAVASVVVLGATAVLMHPDMSERRALSRTPLPQAGLPNLLLIILDTARAANFGLYGYERPTSPEIDDWARSGVVFDWAIAPSPWTLPSHASIFTGRGNDRLRTSATRPLAGDFTTLAEVLASHGYHTAAFAANPGYTTAASGLAQGFARYEDRPWDVANFASSSWISEFFVARPLSSLTPHFTPRTKLAPQLTGDFLTWVTNRETDRPFFAFLNYYDAHGGYYAPDEWVERFGPLPAGTWPEFMSGFRPEGSAVVNTGELDRWVNRYDASIAVIDHHIGMIRDRLSEVGLLENTVAIITSDHGEMWGEHDELSHAASLYTPVLHVPLVVAFPRQVPGGRRVEKPISLVDLPRTVADLIGIAELEALPGESLAPLWQGRDGAQAVALSELVPGGPGAVPWWAPLHRGPMKSLFSGRLHYILNGDGAEELYDIRGDYDEAVNLSANADFSGEMARFRDLLDSLASGG